MERKFQAVCPNEVLSSAQLPLGGDGGAETPSSYPAIVCVVSPDAAVRRSLVLLLEAEGIETRSFASAASLLSELSALGTKPTARPCILVEEHLPGGGSGLELAQRLAEADLDLTTIVLKAAVRPVRGRQLKKVPAGVVFADPFHADNLLQEVRSVLGFQNPRP
ncbi:hypothetical protein [Roseomonas chloroacetimidivorans]|uniref:hypothetical protein n=1 Tax=Roseomonas chloroacetimidivorans TaxID=1766656 RepID=UPI003C70F291